MPRRGTRGGCGLVVGLLVAMIAIMSGAGIVGRNLLVGSAIQEWYAQTYSPMAIDASAVGTPPAEAHLADVPWYSTDQLLGPVSSLRMIAARQGIPTTDAQVSFLMGYTYGARHFTALTLFPFTDGEAGQVAAAPALGLKRLYYETDTPDLYLRAIREEISRGRPVFVSLDRSKLFGGPGPVPSGVVLVGYDAGHLYYYETTCGGTAPCQPGEKAPGERGLPLADDVLASAVKSLGQAAQCPWSFGYSVFDNAPKSEDPTAALHRNGQLLASKLATGPIQGANAAGNVADYLGASAGKPDVDVLVVGLEAAGRARRASASYLRTAFPTLGAATTAAEQLDRAAAAYDAALSTLRAGRAQADVSAAANQLRDAAAADRAAGEAMAGA